MNYKGICCQVQDIISSHDIGAQLVTLVAKIENVATNTRGASSKIIYKVIISNKNNEMYNN